MKGTYLALNCQITDRNGLIRVRCLNERHLMIRLLTKLDLFFMSNKIGLIWATCLSGWHLFET